MSRIDQYPIGSRTVNPNSDFLLGIVSGQLANVPWNTVLGSMTTTVFGQIMLAWFNTLPTSLPAQAGVLWNNGGTLSLS